MKTMKNKLYGTALILAGVIATAVSGGDATALVFFGCIGVPLLFAKENWMY